MLKKISIAYTMLETPKLDEPLLLNSFVLHEPFKVVQFFDELKPFRNSPFKAIKKPTDVTYELLKQDGKKFHPEREHLIPYYSKEPLLSPHIQSYHEQNHVTIHDSDTLDKIQNDLHNSYDTSELVDNVFGDDLLCIDNDEPSIMFHNEMCKSVNLDDFHHSPRSKSDSKNINHKPKSSKFQSFNKFPEIFHLPDTATA